MNQPRNLAGTPMLMSANSSPRTLTRVLLGSGQHDEAWLQRLIFQHPELLPIGSIEPAFSDALSVACEVPCAHGYIDNLLVTPTGDIVIIEVKLWRNPQARRELVAQVLDYIAALTALDYEAFEHALTKGQPGLSGSLYALVADHPGSVDEARFVDAVTNNLARGRVLAIAAADGIRHESQALASLLQSHAGAHFSFALVELGLWRDAVSDALVCMPGTLLQTVMVERGIVRLEGDTARILPASPPVISTAAAPTTISSELFDEALAQKDAALPGLLRSFLATMAPLGVHGVQKASLHLFADVPGREAPIKLGYIVKNGQLWTDNVVSGAPVDPAMRYLERLTEVVGGILVTATTPTVTTNGTSAPNIAVLLRDDADAWYQAIAGFIRDCEQAEQDVPA